MFDILAAGFLIGLTHAMPPGPITFEVLKKGISKGFLAAFQVDVGSVIADAIFFVLIVGGLSQLLSHPAGKLTLWLGGCLLLTFLGLRGIFVLMSKKQEHASERERDMPPLISGFLICITSPFAIVWWAGIFAGAMAVRLGTDILSLLGMFSGIALACLSWYGVIALIGSAGRRLFNPSWMKALSLACSIMMLVFAVFIFYLGYTTLL